MSRLTSSERDLVEDFYPNHIFLDDYDRLFFDPYTDSLYEFCRVSKKFTKISKKKAKSKYRDNLSRDGEHFLGVKSRGFWSDFARFYLIVVAMGSALMGIIYMGTSTEEAITAKAAISFILISPGVAALKMASDEYS